MPKFSIQKAIQINVSVEEAFESVWDFRQWNSWSPWIIAEPDCELSYADDGKSYTWDGKIIGSGQMEVLEELPGNCIQYRLTFLKPWKSVSDVTFLFAQKDEGVEVTWTMNGSLPWFMFFMKSMMTAAIGMDYERGLNMLKDHLETGEVPSKLEFQGVVDFQGIKYLGVRSRCAIPEIGPKMQKDFGRMVSWLKEQEVESNGKPFAIYHDFQIAKGITEFTCCIPVNSISTKLPDEMLSSELPNCKAYQIKHTGPYRHLGNAWSAGIMHSRAKVFRQDRKAPTFEIYESDPHTTPENDLVTVLHFPLK
ncbi:SRPBCC family protein [bacterium]|nr:SRPBCC family protein [bacterium]